MKILFDPLGSEGDYTPVLELAAALKREGHEVRFTRWDSFSWLRPGSRAQALFDELEQVSYGPNPYLARAAAASAAPASPPRRRRLGVSRFGDDHIDTPIHVRFGKLPEHVEWADVVVGTMASDVSRILCQAIGRPYVHVGWSVMSVPSSAHPPIGLHVSDQLPPWSNRLLWAFDEWATRDRLAPYNEALRKLGLREIEHLPRFWEVAELILLSRDPPITVIPEDAPESYRRKCVVTGHMLGPGSSGELDPRLREFIESGPPPIYVIWQAPVFIQAAEQLGVRAIVNDELPANADRARFFRATYAPYDRVFPLVDAVLHHGGHGTAALALRAGIPQIVVAGPGADTEHNGRCLERLGVAPARVNELSLDLITEAIVKARSPAVRSRAKEVAAAMQDVDGLRAAVSAFQSWATTAPLDLR